MTQLSERLNGALRTSGMTQSQLAEAVGVTRQAVSSWCSGATEPTNDKLPLIAKALHVSVADLTAGDQPSEAVLDSLRAEYLSSLGWYFRKAPRDKAVTGGQAAEYAFEYGLSTLGPETAQNSNDEKLEAEPTALLEYAAIELSGEWLEKFLGAIRFDELRPHLEAVANLGEGIQSAASVRAGLQRLDDTARLLVLRVADFNTTGLIGAETGKGDKFKFTAVMRNTLDSDKATTAGGSYGLGKATMWGASLFGLVLARSNLSEPHDGQHVGRFIGRLELSSRACLGEEWDGPGWLGYPNAEVGVVSFWGNAALARDLLIDRDDATTGTSFLVVGAHDPAGEARDLEELVGGLETGVVGRFWPAMVGSEGEPPRLAVRVIAQRNADIVLTHEVDPEDHVPERVHMLRRYFAGDIREELDDPGDVVATRIDLRVPSRPSGEHSHPARRHDAVLIVSQAGDEDEESRDTLAWMRGSQMIVSERKVSGLPVGYRPFRALVLAGRAAALAEPGEVDEDAEVAERFLRAAEPPEHDRWTHKTRVMSLLYPKGARSGLEEFSRAAKSALIDIIGRSMRPPSDGPESLRELLRLKPIATTRDKRPRVKNAVGTITDEGAWEVSAVVALPPLPGGRVWEFAPVVKYATESGAPIPVRWKSLEASDRCQAVDGRLRSREGARTARFRGMTDPTSQPVGALRAAIRVDIRSARAV